MNYYLAAVVSLTSTVGTSLSLCNQLLHILQYKSATQRQLHYCTTAGLIKFMLSIGIVLDFAVL
jgi:hypothetical protein